MTTERTSCVVHYFPMAGARECWSSYQCQAAN